MRCASIHKRKAFAQARRYWRLRTTIPTSPRRSRLTSCRARDRNKLQLELAGRAPVVPSGGNYGDGAIVGPKDWPDAEGSGLSKVPFTTWEDAAIWAKLQSAHRARHSRRHDFLDGERSQASPGLVVWLVGLALGFVSSTRQRNLVGGLHGRLARRAEPALDRCQRRLQHPR